MKKLNWLGKNSFSVWVKPRARKNQVIGLREGALHVHLNAPPVKGAANKALVRFLADLLDVRQGQVQITSGLRSRRKTVRIDDVAPETLQQRIDQIVQSSST